MSEIIVPPIRYGTYIDVPPERVYDTLTTASGWDSWFTKGMELEAWPGGRILFRWVDFGVDHYTVVGGGPVIEAFPPRRFVFQWTPGDSTTTIEFDLEPLGSGTEVRVTESGYTTSPNDLEALVECAGGWGEALTLLKVYLEHGITYGAVPPAGDD
jgi:uncharacterized protein YndB with AHSA1/START domain